MTAIILRALIAGWLLVACLAVIADAQRDVPLSTQLYVERAVSAQAASTASSLAQIRQDVALIADKAERAASEVREMRMAVWGCAGTILISLFMQVMEIRKRKQQEP